MTTDYIEELIRAIDPAVSDVAIAAESRHDEIWQGIVESLTEEVTPHSRRVRHGRRYWGVSALGVTIAATALLLATSVGVPTSAVAATLRAAATADTNAAALPTLSKGQY